MKILARIWHRFHYLPISYRITVGNTLIIIMGAIGGTLITRHLASAAADLWLILIFMALGISITIIVNFLIIRAALQPLHELSDLTARIQSGEPEIDDPLPQDRDPDIIQMTAAVSSLVNRLERRNQRLQALSERAINAQEDERKRIARNLHDDTAQALSMLIIELERLENFCPSDVPLLHTSLVEARNLAIESLKELRKIIFGLRPSILDDLGLVPAIRWYSRNSLEEAGIQVTFNMPEHLPPLPARINTTLFRIAQEGINNIVRHAEAKTAVITLRQNEHEICLWLEDCGRGFDVTASNDQAIKLQQLGLLGIQERADLVGGRVVVESTRGQGTKLHVCVPLSSVGNGDHGKNSSVIGG